MKQIEELPLKDIEKAVSIFRKGGIVIFPTDTVYGIGCRYDLPNSIDRIHNIKKSTQNFPVLLSDINQAHNLAVMNTQAIHIASTYWPGALTILVPSKLQHDKIGLRIPGSLLVRTIIQKLGIPIIGTSANFHKQKSVSKYSDLDPNLIKLVDFVIKGECGSKMESTILDATMSPAKVIRNGAIKLV